MAVYINRGWLPEPEDRRTRFRNRVSEISKLLLLPSPKHELEHLRYIWLINKQSCQYSTEVHNCGVRPFDIDTIHIIIVGIVDILR